MDSRRTLSFLAPGTSTRPASRILSNNDEQDLEIGESNDLTNENLLKRRASRVNLITIFPSLNQISFFFR
jgi:hypothetical protein